MKTRLLQRLLRTLEALFPNLSITNINSRLLWEGSELYTEGSELAQDSSHNFYMGDVDDVYMIKPGWNNEDSSSLTIDADEFGKYSGKIFCFGFWLNKDDFMIYDGASLRFRD